MAQPLHSLFHPHTLAVVGASDRHGSIGRRVFSQLAAAAAVPLLIPINPNHKTIGGLKAYPSLGEAAAEYPIDTAVVILAADKVAAQIKEAAKCGIRNLIVVNEIEHPNAAVRAKLQRAAQNAASADICLLSVCADGLLGLFQAAETQGCAYIGQSAGIADCMNAYAQANGITFNRFLILNPLPEQAVSSGRVIDYIAAQASVKSLLVHIGTLDNPRELISALTAADRRKPVVVLATLTDPAQQKLLVQALTRNRILHADNLTDFFTAAKLANSGITGRGNRLALVSNSPQIGALAFNAIENTALVPAEPAAATARALAKVLPEKTDRHNPLCLPADSAPRTIQAALEQHLHDENNDAVMLTYVGSNCQDSLFAAQLAAPLQQRFGKPLLLVWMGGADTEEVRRIFNQNQNLHFKQSEHALHALEQLNQHREHRRTPPPSAPFHDYRRAASAAAALSEHIQPVLPVAVLPAGRNTVGRLLEALQLPLKTETPLSGCLNLIWEEQIPFGQVLTLSHNGRSISLLPPLSADVAEQALKQIQWQPENTWPWLLDAAEILSRSPEIHDCQIALYHEPQQGLYAADAKLNLQEVDKNTLANNLYAPYPTLAEQSLTLRDGSSAFVRPIRPEDSAMLAQLFAEQSEQSRQSRFMSKAAVSPQLLGRFCRIDYSRDFGLLIHDAEQQPLATANYISHTDGESCEFGISIADRLQGQGIGTVLMNALIEHARRQGLTLIRADILADNLPMRKLAEKLGFTVTPRQDDNSMVEAHLPLPPLPQPESEASVSFSDSIKARIRQQIKRT